MEELINAFGIDARMLVVQIVNFTILLGALWYFLYRPLISLLDSRRDEITETIKRSAQAEELLKNADAERAKRVAEAAKEAGAIVAQAQSGASAKADLIVSDAEAKARRLVEEAESAAQEAKRRSIAESKDEIARMIILGAEKALQEKVQS